MLVIVFEAMLSNFLIRLRVKISYIIKLSFEVVKANKFTPFTIKFDNAGESSIKIVFISFNLKKSHIFTFPSIPIVITYLFKGSVFIPVIGPSWNSSSVADSLKIPL